jgi:uroporphyrin-III C-methyltransferase/precorrin-2 dehydrogenase/sirohydrochlorin ferrochelatase
LFPVFLKLDGLPVVVVGGGPVAASKIGGLKAASAEITVVAPQIVDGISGVRLLAKPFEPTDLDGARFVIAAATPKVNHEVSIAAAERGIFVNAVDDAAHASAYLGGVVRRGGVTLAISTDGVAPALAGLLREALEAVLPEELAQWVEVARAERELWRHKGLPMGQRRPLLLRALINLYERAA